MKKTVLLVLILIFLANIFYFLYYYDVNFFGNVVKGSEENEVGFVSKVIDGDTVVINGESVRLLGIDSDEKGYECYKEAKKRMEELVLNKEIILERDLENKDQYKRLLRYLFLDGSDEKVNINLKMVEEGLAVARFYNNQKYKEEIIEAEKTARENHIGCKWKNLPN